MKMTARIVLIGKNSMNFKDSSGNSRTSYVANIAQDEGRIIDSLRVPEEFYPTLEAGKEYAVELLSTTGKNGTYLRVTGITPIK